MLKKRKNLNKEKIRVAVLMGGPSAEHEVSLNTGKKVLENLDPEKYLGKGIVISKKGKWPTTLKELKNNFDVAFIAMHGEYGEDGTIQKILDKARILYTGSGAKASQIGMDKEASSMIFRKAGLKVPDFSILKIRKNGFLPLGRQHSFRIPLVVKPADRGSSAGTNLVKKIQELPKAIEEAAKFSPNVMLQQYIEGREFTCGVVEIKGKPKALPPTEIVPKLRGFFDYYSKYTAGASREITPPRIDGKEIKKIQTMSLKAHQAIKASGMSRSDFMQDEKGNYWILEINTIPGMTATSLLPQEAKVAGIEFPKLLDLIIANALEK
ncbi:MAG: D-alanine-D-alanine ligase [Parcubacteria group bacterium Gr01-1014_19]|nr:MAG: D-alanine-D-alanine ligase [Parcubacteria group bacterium Gr01-1014_19]